MKRLLAFLLFACSGLIAQVSPISGRALDQFGAPIPFAQIRVCPASSTGLPCTPLASIYQDFGLSTPVANPYTTDAYGNYTVYVGQAASPNLYTTQVSANAGLTWTYVTNGPFDSSGSAAGIQTNLTAEIARATAAENSKLPLVGGTLTGSLNAPSYFVSGVPLSSFIEDLVPVVTLSSPGPIGSVTPSTVNSTAYFLNGVPFTAGPAGPTGPTGAAGPSGNPLRAVNVYAILTSSASATITAETYASGTNVYSATNSFTIGSSVNITGMSITCLNSTFPITAASSSTFTVTIGGIGCPDSSMTGGTATLTELVGTYTVPSGSQVLHIRMVGGGGGGAGSGTTYTGCTWSGSCAQDGGPGGVTGFGPQYAYGGYGGCIAGCNFVEGCGAEFGCSPGTFGGEGGGISGGTIGQVGAAGFPGLFNTVGLAPASPGPGTPFYAVNTPVYPLTTVPDLEYGVGGVGANSPLSTTYPGASGGAAGYVEYWITGTLASTYSYIVGNGGTGGAAGTSGVAGGPGGPGFIIVEAY